MEAELRDMRNHMEEMNTKITKMAHMNKQINALEEFMNDMQNQHKRKREESSE
jgi:polyhydroxyalkanoate synthesis regulator phasin